MNIKYRPEIDGLRAIAVTSVILYHAQFKILGYELFRGGFIGVDIFFVISGYLITLIILKELKDTGKFSLKYFYERRIRRIIPVLLLVMMASMPFAKTYLLPSSFDDYSNSVLYSLIFGSNFYFHFSGQEYGAIDSLLKPFLHTWSLSVEEQFYIFFPIILIISFKFFKNYLLLVLISGFFFSLGFAEWGSRTFPSSTFYFIHTRIWEILTGSILAYYEISLGKRSENKRLNTILPIVGVTLIILSIVFFNNQIYHPSLYTLLPIIGSALIIWFSNKNNFITQILSFRLFVGIGLISYSLYLWHYPIFAFARITYLTHGGVLINLFLAILIIFLSILSYFFIEKPARSKKNNFSKILFLILISYSLLIFFSLKKDSARIQIPKILTENFYQNPWTLLKNLDEEECFDNLKGCKFNIKAEKKVFIIGDSHMATLSFNLKDRIINRDYQFITSTRVGCLYFPGFDQIDLKTNKKNPKCNVDYFSLLEKTLENNDGSIIIFGGRFPGHLTKKKFDNKEGGVEGKNWPNKYIKKSEFNSIEKSFFESISRLSKKNKIILIYPIPEVGWNVPNRLLQKIPKNVSKIGNYLVLENYITTSYKVFKDRTKSTFELFDSLDKKNIHRVFPHKIFCNTIIPNRCITHDDKNIFYADDDHPSLKGAELINDLIMSEIKKIQNE